MKVGEALRPRSWGLFAREVLVAGGLITAIMAGGSGLTIAGRLNSQVEDLRVDLPVVVDRLTSLEREVSALSAATTARNEISELERAQLMERLDRISGDLRELRSGP